MAHTRMDSETRARIVGLLKSGVRPAEIHRQMPDIRLGRIYEIAIEARKAGEDIPAFPKGRLQPHAGGHVIRLAVWKERQVRHLEAAARAREISPYQLMQRVLETVLEDGMVDAVLDDGKCAAAQLSPGDGGEARS